MSLPPSRFAGAFRIHALPKLSGACDLHGLLVALRLETVTEARAEIMTEAFALDAGWLPEEHFSQLEDWVFDTLCAVATEKRTAIELREDRFAPTTADVEAWNARVVEHFDAL